MKKNLFLICSLGIIMLATAPFNKASASTLVDSITSHTNIPCHGMNNGSATVTAFGGTRPYTYSWAPSGGTNATATGLSAGTYTVTVTDALHNTTTATVTITEPNPLIVTTYSLTGSSCSTGCAGASVSGGTPPYTYLWITGCTDDSCCYLSAGTYTLTVVDDNGCTGTSVCTVTTSSTLTGSLGMTPNTNCVTANGTATATASGGSPPYTYLWTPGGFTTATITGLAAGTYNCAISDLTGCTFTSSIAVTSPVTVSLPALTPGNPNSGCNLFPNGYATAVPTGGTLPYTFLWTPGGQTTATASSLTAGSYTCVVHDNSGCSATTVTAIVNDSNTLALSIMGYNNTSCSLSARGYATANASGGSSPYTYLWSPGGATTVTISGLSAGSFTCVVEDNAGCSETSTVTISNSTSNLGDTISTFGNTSCSLSPNGYATATTYGGNPPFTYLWSPGGATTATASGLSAGTYTVVVTDNTGCTATTTCTVGTSTFSATITGHNASCSSSNGWAVATPIGGTSPFTYSWTPSGGSSATATGLSVGTYTCVVKDNSGCSATATTTIASGSMTLTFYSIPDSSGCNGVVEVIPSGGSAPYTYVWSPYGQTTQTITGLCSGVYCVTVTDVNGCTVSGCDTINGSTGGCGGYTPNICYVTTDTNFQHNIVVWQKPGADSNAIDSIVILRGVTTSLYTQVGAVSVHNYTYFTDLTSDPNVTAYYYELSIVDTCNTSPVSSFHESVLLQCTHGLGNNINLNWNFYQGATVNYYRILRDSNGTGHWQVLDSVPGTINAYTDTNAPTNPNLRYRLNMNWNVSCTTYLTVRGHNHNVNSEFYNDLGYSNVSNAFPSGIIQLDIQSAMVDVYPNPTNGNLNISINAMKGATDLFLTDALGRVLITEHKTVAPGYKETINLESLQTGVYFLTIENNGQKIVKKVTKL